MAKLTDRLLKRAARAAERKQEYQALLTEAFIERYGVTYSDVDADEIIDVLDYHGGDIDLDTCDRVMSGLGYPPAPPRALEQGD